MRENGKKVAVIGAFDRHNYGDLIFPMIVGKFLETLGLSPAYYSLFAADMTDYGSVRVEAITDLIRGGDSRIESVILAGGEILGATWPGILGHSLGSRGRLTLRSLEKTLGTAFLNRVLARSLASPDFALPFIYADGDFGSGVRVIYNAVGGAAVSGLPPWAGHAVFTKLRKAAYVSCRDRPTQQALQSGGVENVWMSPDSAVLMSRHFPRGQLAEMVPPKVRALIGKGAGYLCFQSAWPHARPHLPEIAEGLMTLSRTAGSPVVLLVIGSASGHEDDRTCRELARLIDGRIPLVVADGRHILATMGVIAHSRLYLGTSLHGTITACAYRVPHIGLQPHQVHKVKAFLDTWGAGASAAAATYRTMVSTASTMLSSRTAGRDIDVAALQELALANFDRIRAVIQ